MHDAVLSAETLHRGWLALLMLELRLNGAVHRRTLIEHPSGATVLPFDPDRGVVTVIRQTRYAPLYLGHAQLAEAVGGVAERGEDAAETARREAMEEVGIRFRRLIPVGHVWMTPSTTTERVHLFLGEYGLADRIGAGGGAAGEDEAIDLAERPAAAVWREATGGLADAKLFMCLQALRLHAPAMFAA
jgi:nudix-type nucleoside diphosphatase (YffH/AdpP family)